MNQTCPCCEKHCPIERLSCPRGRAHFGVRDGAPKMPGLRQEPASPEDRVLAAMRGCGHYLHHQVGAGEKADSEKLLSALSGEEKKTLADLLEKCLRSWNME